ncbi:uncharacterized membrane protein YgdD (TMEM256/DUF423 family) [Melghiribacillus thermohalophilus]|uniref:Uncharacterized membrane protein YgdD (TMEM256/DUF423 family) n=1 Tax=Melghiribacillus thermohalophilus TaxID=1324956 RepID=A0A4V2V2U1_9BACI|nr:DUF423 domain-containing protein [Melghiribacillus thermohalophilus]TCT26336.1 uncharacterized membrane protein YgdD (TMEM256/DUF423 family) [Melghiribacillus thermohalophilus]
MKLFFIIGAISGFLSVALGAFGAHGLEGRISEKMMKTWEKAVDYQMFHTTAIFVTALLMTKLSSTSLVSAGWFFLIGILLFSGSLYIYSTSGIKFLAMITPFGGIAFLIGWVLLGYATVRML